MTKKRFIKLAALLVMMLAKSEQISATDQILSVLIVIFWYHISNLTIKMDFGII